MILIDSGKATAADIGIDGPTGAVSVASFTSPVVQELRRLLARRRDRREAGRFVVEGPVLVRDAVDADLSVVRQFVPVGSPEAAIDGAGEVVTIADDVLERLGSTQAPQAPIALVEFPTTDAGILSEAAFVVILDRIQDPGNLGTILRSSEAAGVDAVVLTPGSADPYNPKVVRASAGALFHLPVIEADLDAVVDAGLVLHGTSSHDHPTRRVVPYTDADLTRRVALVMGNEAAGLPAEWDSTVGPVDRWITIPHRGRSESLNVAMATTVLVFEAARQRAGR